jgi:hypothetical protein
MTLAPLCAGHVAMARSRAGLTYRGLDGTNEGEWIMRISLLGIMAILGVACGSDQGEPAQTAETSGEQRATTGGESEMASQHAMSADCPMHVQGTSVQAEDVEGGVALVFVTTGDVGALRERVRNMAATHEAHGMHSESRADTQETMRPESTDAATAGAKIGDADDGVSAGGMPQDSTARPATAMMEVDTRVEDVADGARLVLIATNPTDVEALRIETGQHAQRMSAGDCAMTPHAMP